MPPVAAPGSRPPLIRFAPADDYGFFRRRWIAAYTTRVMRAFTDRGSRGRKSPRRIGAAAFRISASATAPKAAADGPPDAHGGVRPVSGADDLKARAVSIALTVGRRFFPAAITHPVIRGLRITRGEKNTLATVAEATP